MKSVLVHINRDSGQEARFQAALDVARGFRGHLVCVQTSPLEGYLSADPYGVSYLLGQTLDQIREQEQAERDAFEARLRAEGVSWDWHCDVGAPVLLLAGHSWLTDLVVVSTPGRNWPKRLESPPTAADLVLRVRAPVLAVPESYGGIDLSGLAMVAWNGSPEACHAIRAALPLLRGAGSVVLVSVADGSDHDFPATEGATYLSRHGIATEMVELRPAGRSVADVLLNEAAVRGAAWLAMGAYGHSRLRESILGGATRDMLEHSNLPLLLAH
jgi:nucleotide-binding universal stress UspA family protein